MLEANFISGYETVTVQGLTQWDKGQKLQITGLATLPATFQVHFANATTVEAIVMLGSTVAGVGTVDIPNSLLESGLDIKAWIYVIDAEGSETIKTILFPLTKRTKPADFISEPNPTEQSLLEQTMSGVNDATANMQSQINSTNAQVALKANQTSLDATNAIVAQKADKSEVTNIMTPKGNIAYASLPKTGNTVGWYYYCPDGDGIHGAGNYVWNGSAWYFGGTGDEGYSKLKSDLDEIQSDNGVDYKQISSELTQTKTVLEDTSSDGALYVSGNIIISNPVAGYKKMILSVAELPSTGTLIIPYDGITGFTIVAGELGDWSDKPTVIQTYSSNALKSNERLPVVNMGWNFTEGKKYATLDCAVMKSKIDSKPALYFYIKNDSNQWFVPYVLRNGTKKPLNWLEITEENADEDLKAKVNREIPSIDFLFKIPLSFYPRKILCIGDSLTQGHIAGHSPAHFEAGVNYPAYFARMTGAECTNAGVSGITSQGWYENQFSNYDYIEYDMIFLFLGTNGGLTDTVSGANTNDQTGYYCSIIEGIKNASPNTKIVLFGNVEPFYSDVIAKIANYYSLPYIDIYGQSYYEIRRRGTEEPTIYHPATSDWVHFSRIGYCVLAQVVYLLLGEKILEMSEYFDGTYS